MRKKLIKLIRKSGYVDTWNYHTDDFKEPDPIPALADYLLANNVIVPSNWLTKGRSKAQLEIERHDLLLLDIFLTRLINKVPAISPTVFTDVADQLREDILNGRL